MLRLLTELFLVGVVTDHNILLQVLRDLVSGQRKTIKNLHNTKNKQADKQADKQSNKQTNKKINK